MKTFQVFMDGLYGGPARAPWWTWYPIEDVLAVDSDVAFVDVAGGNGHQTAGLLRAYPGVKSRLIVQDLPEVIEGIKVLDSHIERMPYDFLTPQPETVKGARVFLLSNILHDHPDNVCHTILGNIRAAYDSGPLQDTDLGYDRAGDRSTASATRQRYHDVLPERRS
ncbi:hypothetical protein LTR33_012247 [Friedmanniomyces endolithicus]|nr:hypothetical protein LTR33_012247 [Friedmanniomyces endolithicus]